MRYRNNPYNDELPYNSRLLIYITIALFAASVVGLCLLLLGQQGPAVHSKVEDFSISDSFEKRLDLHLTPDETAPAEETYSPVYTLDDKQLVAPKPNPNAYGEATDPAQLQDVLNQARTTLGMTTSLFKTDTPIFQGSTIMYYLDETIFAVTWKQVFNDCVYTFSEVKISHPSQFRRFFSDGRFGSGVLRTTTDMSQTVNAVVASSGDYYGFRSIGIVVNEGKVFRHMGHFLDTCYIDDQGDLLFTYAGDIIDQETAQKFVDDHNVRFSISFGPVLIENGEFCVPDTYNSGEINNRYSRAAICQMDSLHYVLVTANSEEPHYLMPTVANFGETLFSLGIPTAYALDGGQTAAIAMDGKLINKVSYGSQRAISDIVYFATAIPE